MKAAVLLAGVLVATPAVAQYDKFVREAKAIAAAELKDPDSAKFRNLFVSRYDKYEDGELILCGEMNAKNAFGAYVGFKPFMTARNEATRQLMGLQWQLVSVGGKSAEAVALEYCGNPVAQVK